MPKNRTQGDLQTKSRLDEPKMYHVIMHNDDVTTMDFVVKVLCVVFFKTTEQATLLMLDVHEHDSAIVGTYSYDIALSKANKALQLAKSEGFPLRLTVAPADSDN